ncbi:MAG: DUF2461 domain-containing protein [Chloroflexi bacterium]|nr:DUF2461 domain-containing protein [Chloroflexota bacterium]
MSDFPGFPPETQQFLRELRENNTREWFAANKGRYEEFVKAPAVHWVTAMGARLKSIEGEIVIDTRTNGSGSLMRAARDTRFSKDKSPYKVNVAMMWWRGSGKKMQHPGFGMQITPDDAGLMVGMFHFAKPMLDAYRQAVLDEALGADLVSMADSIHAAGYQLSGSHYKTAPRGFDKNHPRVEWLRYNNLHAGTHDIPPNVITTPRLIDVCFEHFSKLAPILRWLVRVQERFGGV